VQRAGHPLYRVFPSYGESFAAKVAPDAGLGYADLEFTLGAHRYRCRVQVDTSHGGGKGKTEAWLWRDGDPQPIAGERVTEVDRELAAILPPLEVLLASNFACQSREGSFFELPKAERKALFIELLGLAHLQEVAEAARAQGSRAASELERQRTALTVAEAQATRATELDRAIAEADGLARRAQHELATAEAACVAAQTEHTAAAATVAERRAQADAAAAEHERLTSTAEAARQTLETVDASREGLRSLLDDAEEIRRCAAEAGHLTVEIAGAESQRRQVQAEIEPLLVQQAPLAEQLATLREQYRILAAAKNAADEAAARIATAGDLRAAEAAAQEALAGARAAVARQQTELAQADAAAEAEAQGVARRAALTAEAESIAGRRSAVATIDLAHPMCSACPLTADAQGAIARLDAIATEIATLPAGEAARAARDRARERLQTLAQAAEQAADAAGQAAAAAAAQQADRERAAQADLAAEELGAITAAGGEVKAQLAAVDAAIETARARLTTIDEKLTILTGAREVVAPTAARLAELQVAEERRAALERTASEATRAGQAAIDALAALPNPDVAGAEEARDLAAVRLASEQGAVERLRAVIAPALEAAQKARGEREAVGDAQARADQASAAADALACEAGDFAHLDRAFGRDGIQALEIDAAGPAVTALANDLLTACYGPRFQLRLDTTEPGKKKGVIKEVFDVTILDAEARREGKRGSGGEQVILDEALRLAIAIFNAQRSGAQIRTLWRDETAGALSPENASRYVQMLRRARQLGAFSHVLFVSHAEAVWSQADTKVFVAGGTVTMDAA